MPAQRTTRSTPEERFWARTRKAGPEECWEWVGTKDQAGYGSFYDQGKTVRAHRFAYELLVGPIPEGLVIDHLCRNPPCVNPGHLEPVTGRENILRGIGLTAQNARKTHCKRGHALTPDNIYPRSYSPHARGHCLTCKREYEKARWAKQKEAGVSRSVVAWVEVENPTERMFRQAASGMTAKQIAHERTRGKVWALRGLAGSERHVFWCLADRPETHEDFHVSPVYSIEKVPKDAECEKCGGNLHELHNFLSSVRRPGG